jgi:hypothetical protein
MIGFCILGLPLHGLYRSRVLRKSKEKEREKEREREGKGEEEKERERERQLQGNELNDFAEEAADEKGAWKAFAKNRFAITIIII